MGKIRIVKQHGLFRVEKKVTKYQYNEPYEDWEVINADNYFTKQEDAELFVEKYIRKIEDEKEIIVKEYKF